MGEVQGDNQVYLSAEHIRRWKSEYAVMHAEQLKVFQEIDALSKRQKELAAGIQNIGDKLRHAAPFSPGLSEWLQEQEFELPENNALTDAILMALLRSPANQSANRSTLQHLVPQLGYPAKSLQANPTFLSVALKQLLDRQQIIENPQGYYRLTEAGRAEALSKG